MNTQTVNPVPAGLPLRVGLWGAQLIVASIFLFGAYAKLLVPQPELARMIPWTADYSTTFVHGIGLVDLAGGLGILLPSLIRVAPGLTIPAALGCAALQAFAIVFHLSRGETMALVFNIPLLAMSVFVLWGRSRKARIEARG